MKQVEDRHAASLVARSSARTSASLCVVLSAITVVGWYLTGGVTLWQWYLALITTAVFTLVMLTYPSIPGWLSMAVMVCCTGVMLFASAFSTSQLAQAGVRFDAFNGYKLGAIATAMIAPPPGMTGLFIILFCAIAPLVQYFASSPAAQAAFSVQEPWYTLTYAVVAFFILRYRLKSLEVERTLIRLRAEQESLKELAKIFVALRDLTNTPLQSIELTMTLLESEHLSQGEAVRFMKQSMLRLRELSQILAMHENDIDWSMTGSSFDAVAMLQEKTAALYERFSGSTKT